MGGGWTATRDFEKSACRNCPFPRELESQTVALAGGGRRLAYLRQSCCRGTSQLAIDVVGGVGASPLQSLTEWRHREAEEKSKKFRVTHDLWYNVCGSSLERWSTDNEK